MPNMGYVRFQNTLQDLRDCHRHMDDDDLDDEEQEARQRMIRLCKTITEEYGDEITAAESAAAHDKEVEGAEDE